MLSRSLGHRAPLLWLVLPLIAGLGAAKTADFGSARSQLVVASIAASLALIASQRASRLWTPALVIAMFFAGAASYQLHRVRLKSWDVLPPREAKLSLR